MRPPGTIVSLLAGGTEILYGLGLGDLVVGISHECDYPPEAMGKPRVTFANVDATADSRAIDEQVKTKLASNEPLYGIDVDLLAELRPDLIVTQSQCAVCAVSADDLTRAAAGNPLLRHTRVVSLNPASLQGVFDDIRCVGQAAGVPTRAESYVASLQARVGAVRAATAALSPHERPRTVCIEWIEPLMIAANWMPELIELAGGRSGLTKTGERTVPADWKAARQFDPEVVVIAPCGFDLERSVSESRSLSRLPGWSDLAAVRQGRVFAADGNAYFNRSGPRIVDTLEILAAVLHPRWFDRSAEWRRYVRRLLW